MSLLARYRRQAEQFVSVCHEASRLLYVTSHGGNLAWKLEENLLLITPTKVNKGQLTPEDLVFIDLQGNTVEGEHKPTGETPMYLRFFADRPDIVSVVHCHPPYVGAFAIMAAPTDGPDWLMRAYYPETVTEVGPVPTVPYGEPLTQQLADNFADYLPRYNSFLMANHGLVTMTRGDIRWTWMTVQLLEMSAQSLLAAIQAGSPRELSREALEGLSNVMATRDLPLPGADGVHQTLLEVYGVA